MDLWPSVAAVEPGDPADLDDGAERRRRQGYRRDDLGDDEGLRGGVGDPEVPVAVGLLLPEGDDAGDAHVRPFRFRELADLDGVIAAGGRRQDKQQERRHRLSPAVMISAWSRPRTFPPAP